MNREDIINRNIDDLNIGYEFAVSSNNNILKMYIKNQIDSLSDKYKMDIYKDYYLAFEYSIDLVTFIKCSSIVNDLENKDYFKDRLKQLCSFFPKLREDKDIFSLV